MLFGLCLFNFLVKFISSTIESIELQMALVQGVQQIPVMGSITTFSPLDQNLNFQLNATNIVHSIEEAAQILGTQSLHHPAFLESIRPQPSQPSLLSHRGEMETRDPD